MLLAGSQRSEPWTVPGPVDLLAGRPDSVVECRHRDQFAEVPFGAGYGHRLGLLPDFVLLISTHLARSGNPKWKVPCQRWMESRNKMNLGQARQKLDQTAEKLSASCAWSRDCSNPYLDLGFSSDSRGQFHGLPNASIRVLVCTARVTGPGSRLTEPSLPVLLKQKSSLPIAKTWGRILSVEQAIGPDPILSRVGTRRRNGI